MSNEIINPYQQFLDDAGNPLAAGTITFYVNNTTTLTTVYSDEALTIAQANPYTLDGFGRVIGDVKFSGKIRIVIKTSTGAVVRTIDNVSVYDATAIAATILATGIAPPVADYTALLALTPADYPTGTVVTVTNDGIAGQFKVVTGSATHNGGTIITDATWNSASKHFRRLIDGVFYNSSWWDLAGDNVTDDLSKMQAAWDAAYLDGYNLDIPAPESRYYFSGTLEFPPSTTTETRGTAFVVKGSGAGNVFVTNPTTPVCIFRGDSATLPVFRHVNRLGFVNTGGAFDIRGIRFEGSNSTQVVKLDMIGEYAFFERNEIKQSGTGDGLTVDYFMKGNIGYMNVLNGDAFVATTGLETRTGAAVRIKADDGGGIPTLRKITGRGFDTAYIIGEGATSSDNMSGLLIEQCESSIVRVGIDIRQYTLKATLDTCYFEGINGSHIIDKGTATDIHGGMHFL
jgi:hypothetical protein